MPKRAIGYFLASLALVAVAGCGAGATNSSSAASDDVIPAGQPIKIGHITSESGAFAAQFAGIDKTFQARVDQLNEQGGSNGHKIEVVYADDASTADGNLAAARKLVGDDKVFAVVMDSSFLAGSVRYLHDAGVPVIGTNVGGPQWGQQPYTNMFGSWGSHDPNYGPYSTLGAYFKGIGAQKVASVGLAQSPSSNANAKNTARSAEVAGLQVAYLNTSAQIGNTNFGAEGAAIAQSGADTLFASMTLDQDTALLTAARQAGAKIQHVLFPSGYNDKLPGTPAAQSLQGASFLLYYAPVQSGLPATQNVIGTLQRYAGYKPGQFYGFDIMGWLSAEAVIKGLEVAGDQPTRKSFIAKLREVKDYDAGGLLPAKVDYSRFGVGSGNLGAGGCAYIVTLTGSDFRVENGNKPVCGGPIAGS